VSTDAVLTAGHLDQAMALSTEAGWNQIAEDWSLFITHGTLFGAFEHDRLIATAAAIPFGPAFGWISMVLTTPAHRGRGHARRLTALATATLRDTHRAALLDATPAGAEVYQRLGFKPLCAMQRWHGSGHARLAPTQPPTLSLDRPAFGADRAFLLHNILARPDTKSFASDTAFALARRGALATQIGPVIGTPADAAPLVQSAIQATQGRIFIDILEAGFSLLPSLGLTLQRPFTRMAIGLTHLPGDPAKLLAATSPEFG
jgi:GNAT superfamily N-acetyltransferase